MILWSYIMLGSYMILGFYMILWSYMIVWRHMLVWSYIIASLPIGWVFMIPERRPQTAKRKLHGV